VAKAVTDLARVEGADDIVIGSTRRSRVDELLHGPVVSRFIKQAGSAEIHVVPAPATPPVVVRVGTRLPFSPFGGRVALPARRRAIGWLMASLLPVIVLFGLLPVRSSLGIAGALFAVLLIVVFAAAVGGRGPALLATLIGFLLADFLFTVPYYSLRVDRVLDIVALVAFAVAAVVIGTLVDIQARQGVRIETADSVAEGLARLLADQVAESAEVSAPTLESLRRTFDLDALSVLEPMEHGWEVLASAGAPVPRSPADAAHAVELSATRVLALGRNRLEGADPQLLRAFVTELRLARATDQLRHLTR
jgi:two-component system, OmpR family, sensor histidine kinase KdpD